MKSFLVYFWTANESKSAFISFLEKNNTEGEKNVKVPPAIQMLLILDKKLFAALARFYSYWFTNTEQWRISHNVL